MKGNHQETTEENRLGSFQQEIQGVTREHFFCVGTDQFNQF